MPHAAAIQQSFGRHDISETKVAVGDAAAEASEALGAHAYAQGDRVAFAQDPDLRTAAHEAAHVVQQRAGQRPAGAIDTPGDHLEDHADRVADAVVSGRSAEPLLDELGQGATSTETVQRDGDVELAAEILDPAVEITIIGHLQQVIAPTDILGLQGRVRNLTTVFRAIPDAARMALHARLMVGAAADRLAALFHGRLHHATRTRLLHVLRGDVIPLPTRYDAMTGDGFVAHLPDKPFKIEPSPLTVHPRLAPNVTARIALAGEFGPAADEPPVAVTLTVFDPEGNEHAVERLAWMVATPTSLPAAVHLQRPGTYRLEAEITQGGLVIAQRHGVAVVRDPAAETLAGAAAVASADAAARGEGIFGMISAAGQAMANAAPAADLAGAAALSPEQLQASHSRMAARLPTEANATERDQLANDRNLVEFVAANRKDGPVELAEEPIVPGDLRRMQIGLDQDILEVSADPAWMRQWIERVFMTGVFHPDSPPGEKGMPGVEALADLIRIHDPADGLSYDDSKAYIHGPVLAELSRQVSLLRAEVRAFEKHFGDTAKDVVRKTLAQSRAVAQGELDQYGIVVTEEESAADENGMTSMTTSISGGDNAKAKEMAAAAGELAGNQREIDRMRGRIARLNAVHEYRSFCANVVPGAGPGAAAGCGAAPPVTLPSDPDEKNLPTMVAALERLIASAEVAHMEQIQERVTEFPIFASFKRTHDDKVDVDADGLDRLRSSGRAQAVWKEVGPVLANIAKTETALNEGDLNVWKENRVVQLTMAQMLVAPGSFRGAMVESKIAKESEGSWTDWALMALTFGLAILAAIPTGGSSLVAAVVVTAEVAGVAMDLYLVADHIEEYQLDEAKTGTDLDQARAISANHPSLFWLALDIIMTGVGMAGAAKTFGEVAQTMSKAARSAREAETAVAGVHRLAREGKLSADAAERLEGEIAVLAHTTDDAASAGAVAARLDERVRVTPNRVEELSERLGVPVELDETGKLGDGVELHYTSSGTGDILPTVVKVGPDALLDDVLAHAGAVRRITRYNGTLGKLRRLWDRFIVLSKGGTNPFKKATLEWEAFEELAKIDELVAMRRTSRMGTTVVDPTILDDEIDFLEKSRARYEAIVKRAEDSGSFGEAAGHIDKPKHWDSGVSRDYKGKTRTAPDASDVKKTGARDAHGAGVSDVPGRGSRAADDILADGPSRTADMLPDGWRDRSDAARIADHGRALDQHELEYRVALREAQESGQNANVIGAAKAKITEVEGERAATRFMLENHPDAELYRGFAVGIGYDQVWVRRANGRIREYIIVEAKGPGAELLQDGLKGVQMSNEWVTKTAEQMKTTGNPLGDEILRALEGDVKDVVVSGHVVEADGVGGAIERSLPEERANFTLHDDP